MGLFSNADYIVKKVDKDILHITDLNLGNISVTNDVQNVLSEVGIQYDLTKKRVQYTDSEGQVDRILQKDGKFQGFAPGPWNKEEEDAA